MVATIFSFTKARSARENPPSAASETPKVRDWSNQELSDLYRAVASLGQSGIMVHVDRGVTDEGDPWMVLCRSDGEVFIHFCRLDGRYLLDSPAIARPLQGRDFAELIDQFIAKASAAAAPNVVAFRASKVFLHPAALLTILVWSLYVWSSDTTEAHEAGGDALPLPDPFAAPAELSEGETTVTPPSGKPAVLLDGLPADRLLARLVQAMDQSGALPAGNTAAAMQMLAVVGTLVLSAAISHDLGHDDAPSTAKAIDILLAQALPTGKPVDFIDFHEALTHSAWEGSLSAKALLALHEPLDVSTLASTGPVQPLVPATPHVGEVSSGPILPAEFAPAPVHSDAVPLLQAPIVVHAAAETHVELPSAVLSDSFAALLGTAFNLASYEVNGVGLLASFNVADADNLLIGGQAEAGGDLLIKAPQLADEPTETSEATFDDAARAFIDFFLNQSDDVEVLASANELVLIDLSAFDDTMDRAYSYTWSMADGGTISTLGHYDVFASHALV